MLLSPRRKTALTEWFQGNFAERGELGASLSIWTRQGEWLALAEGFRDRARTRPWNQNTLVPIWSATKGPAAVATLLALAGEKLPLDCPVAEIWPEFSPNNKEEITLAQVLSHSAGLCALDERASILNYEAVIEALERQPPLWRPGTALGYHARTFGFLIDEIVRRVTGAGSIGEFLHYRLLAPCQLDFWLGQPPEHRDRVAAVYPGKISLSRQDQDFMKAYATPGTLTQRAFSSPVGLTAVAEINEPGIWNLGLASMGGLASARGLAGFYHQVLHSLCPAGYLNLAHLTQPLIRGDDLVLLRPIAFAAGVMLDPVDPESGLKIRRLFGPSVTAFGHPGAGGSLAFADPENGLSFAYVMNQMEAGPLPNEKALGLVERLYDESLD